MALLALLAASAPAWEARGEAGAEPDSIEWLWLSVGAGYQWADLRILRLKPEQHGGDLVPVSAAGPAPSAAVGLRVAFLTLGLRATTVRFLDRSQELRGAEGKRQLSTLDAELGFRASLGRWRPFLLVGGGYTTFGDVGDALSGIGAGLGIDGLNITAAGGLDYYLSRRLSLGARAGTSVLILAPEGRTISELAAPGQDADRLEGHARLLRVDGSSVGLLHELSLGVGLHF